MKHSRAGQEGPGSPRRVPERGPLGGDAWSVPESERYPEGVKYSFQYLGPNDESILRYDNANDSHGVGRHHRHYRGEVAGLQFEGLRSHLERFLEEVETIHDRAFA